MTIYLSLLVAIIALAVYAFSEKAKIQDIARIAFGCGLLAFLMRIAELPSIKSG